MKVNELEKSTTPIGARVNAHFVSLLKEVSIPISSVVESMVGHFLTLSDDEKEKVLYRYNPQNIDVDQLQYPKCVWSPERKGNMVCVESMREILMNAEAEDLAVLSTYCIEINKRVSAGCDDFTLRYIWINDLILNFQAVAKNFFYAKMEYGELLFCIADDLGLKLDKKSEIENDLLEVMIAKQYIIKCLMYIPEKQKREIAQILGVQVIKDTVIIETLSMELQNLVTYRLICWLANANQQAFTGRIPFWDSTGGEVFYGRKKFREYIFYPIIHIAMLRGKYRCSRLPQCPACAAIIVPGSKYCNECGAKL